MQTRVIPLRHQGRRLEWRDAMHHHLAGDLLTHSITERDVPVLVARLRPVDQGLIPDDCPTLWNPQLVAISPQGIRLRGYEPVQTDAGVVAVVQEWLCQVA